MLSTDNEFWVFDQYHLKDAITLLLLNHKQEKNQPDLELKKLISLQFENDSDLQSWAIDVFDKVNVTELFAERFFVNGMLFRSLKTYQSVCLKNQCLYQSYAKINV